MAVATPPGNDAQVGIGLVEKPEAKTHPNALSWGQVTFGSHGNATNGEVQNRSPNLAFNPFDLKLRGHREPHPGRG